ncbi:MAG TPA: RHS repeat-associated core domain-containing protein, partial [Methylocystis sp.]|nr:RHS repeat-associated core domain-containing protein [Methylocystis sp.]
GLPVATLQPSGTYYIAPDHLGAPHQIANGGGTVVWLWEHDPFGNGAPTASAGFTYNLRFPGQYYDAETGLHHNGFRDYDPRTGRYIESDPIGLAAGVNTYGYVGGNPVWAVDVMGLCEADQSKQTPWWADVLAWFAKNSNDIAGGAPVGPNPELVKNVIKSAQDNNNLEKRIIDSVSQPDRFTVPPSWATE